MEKADIVIIGAGIVGLAIASSLLKNNDSVVVIEKNNRIGLESSTHNSGVIHSGIHYRPGTLKASLSVIGNKMIYEICKKNYIPCAKTGKLTVATNEDEVKEIYKLMENGQDNGVEGIKLLYRDDIKKLEPNVDAEIALFTPTTGIVEQTELINYFYSLVINRGGIIATGNEVTGIDKKDRSYKIDLSSNSGKYSIEAGTIINSAGLYSDKIAEMAGIDVDIKGYRLEYYKGDYFRILGNPPVRMPVYPVPNEIGLGIHLTPDIAGSVSAGPNSYHVDSIDYKVESDERDYRDAIKKYLPSIDNYAMNEDSSGIRPKLKFRNIHNNDFIIKHEAETGLFGFINLIGIESPGLTASPAIGEYVAEIYEKEIKK